ncbi:MAG: DUF4982 domain-containing protein [Luteolibacter sp.]
MKTSILLTIPALVLAGAAFGAETSGTQRAKYNFNSDWRVNVSDPKGAENPAFADSDWKSVTLPYAWNEDSAFKVKINNHPDGIAWYRKTFKLPQNAKDQKVFLEFEGIRQAGEFFLNGESIGISENGVMAFGFDISDKVKPWPEENVLAARIDNAWNYKEKSTGTSFQWNHKAFNANYGGINKNVFLHIADKLHQTLPLYSNLGTTGVYIHAKDFDIKGKSATVTAESEVKNDHAEPKTFSYEVTITETDGKVVKSFKGGETTIGAGETATVSASAEVSSLNFWSWGYGYLYDVTTTLKVDDKPVDQVVTRTGFRKLEFGNGMIKLNDRTIQIHGYAPRSTNEWPALGNSVPPWMSDFSNGLAVKGNANLFRWMHVTPWKQDVESCDRVGLMQALPAGDSEKDVVGRQWEHRVELMRDATIYNRNNPSVVMYEGGNENISEEHMAELKAVRDKYDPHGGRATGSREMLSSKVAEWGGEMLYINKSARIPFWATEYCRDEALRKYWDDWSPPYHKDGDGPEVKPGQSGAPYNRNQDTFAIEDVIRWYDYWRERPGTGTRVSSGGVNIIFSDSNTHARGAENYRRSGEVDAMRIPKDAFFAHKVMWDGWVDVEKPRVHIIGHWNYEPTVTKPVYAVSSADKVELFINGKSRGFGEQSYRFLYTWDSIAFEAGEIKAVGYDADGKKLCETNIKTIGEPARIKLTPRTGPKGLKADGADIALIDVEVVDANGHRCPLAMNPIQFELEGPAEWRGGIAQGPDNYILSKELPVECGINRVMIRSNTQAGEIVLKATAPGLKPAEIKLVSSPFETADGLTKVLPDEGLKSRLERGPTPAGDSVVPTRTPIRIVGATAGANEDKVATAFDDNEETSWKNDGKRSSAWIQFKLERQAEPHELTLKLGGWRNKAYPIRITLNGTEIYTGTTPKTLGYVTLPLKPAKGDQLRIELVGTIDVKDGFGLVEVTGKKLEDVTNSSNDRGTLEIIEAEVYEPLTTTKR